MIHHELLIVRGGAAGLMAAVTAKDFGIDVAILEATDRIGKKNYSLQEMDAVIFLIFPLQNLLLIIIAIMTIFIMKL